MKRIITILVILILLGATVFSVGYLPIRLRDGSVALLYSKTSGWDPEPIRAGDFVWRWELLIPTNATIYHFPEDSRTVHVRSTALLPSAEVYARLLDGAPSLSQNLRFSIRYRFTPEAFARYAPRGLREESLGEWYDERDAELSTAALVIAGRAVIDGVDREELIVPALDITDAVLSGLRDRFPDLDVQGVTIETLEIPDPQLYRLARDTYRAVQQARETALLDAARELATVQATADQRAATLQQYGRIFSEYPILLEYLEITARTGRDPLSIDTLPQGAVPAQ